MGVRFDPDFALYELIHEDSNAKCGHIANVFQDYFETNKLIDIINENKSSKLSNIEACTPTSLDVGNELIILKYCFTRKLTKEEFKNLENHLYKGLKVIVKYKTVYDENYEVVSTNGINKRIKK